jgi:protein SCO1/2
LDKDKTQHTGMVKFGVESLERWGMAAAMADPKRIARLVRRIEPKDKVSV